MTRTTIEELTAEVVAWADTAFKNRTPQSAFLKLYEEIGELIRNPRRPGEYADVMIMLLDLAHMHEINLGQATIDKMGTNRERTWVVTEMGTFQHVEGKPKTKKQQEAVQLGASADASVEHAAVIDDPVYQQAYDLGKMDGAEGTPSRTWAGLQTFLGIGMVSESFRGEVFWWYGRGYTDGEVGPS